MQFLASVLAALLAAACLSTPARPRDDASSGSADAMVDASSTVVPGFVSRTAGLTPGTSGTLAIPPPTDAIQGNLIVLFLDRFWAAAELPASNGWQTVTFLAFDGDAHQIFYRVASADEASRTADYAFPAGTFGAPPDAAWVIDVWRDARAVQMLSTAHDPLFTYTPGFPSATAMANEVVMDVSVAGSETACSQPTGIDDRTLWSLLANPPGNVDAMTFMCTPSSTFGQFQIRIVP